MQQKKASEKPSMFDDMLAAVRRVPRGKVATYGDIAYAAGYPGSARQVAWALHQSRGAPWQRIVGAEGKILLSGEMAFEQRIRLQSEGVGFIGLKVDMRRFHATYAEIAPGRKKRNGAGSQRNSRSTATKTTVHAKSTSAKKQKEQRNELRRRRNRSAE